MNKKLLSSMFFSIILICSFVLAGATRFGTVTAATNFSGLITSDTTWTKANSPYMLTGPVGVAAGVTLTIEPGVTVYLDDTYLLVDGTLYARGTSTEKISLLCNGTSLGSLSGFVPAIKFTSTSTSWDEQTNTGSIIENAIVSSTQDTHTISIVDTSPKINNNTVINSGGQRGIWIEGVASPIISNNSITSEFAGITVLSMSPGGEGRISANIISGCEVGIEVYSSSPIIEHNLIINNKGNKINGNGGIRIDHIAKPVIRNNTIVRNSVGINVLEGPSPIIEFNNIYDNDEYSIYMYSDSMSDINATYNWWGTTDVQTINQTIRDYYEDFTLGEVSFVPFLTELNPEAPITHTFTITASAGEGGSISPSGSVSVPFGDDQTFTVTPDSGYQIASVLMDGAPATAPYKFFDVVTNGHTITATFEENPTPTPSPSPSPSPTPTPTPTPSPTATPTPTPSPTPTPTPTVSPTASPSPSPTPTPEIPEFPLGIILSLLMIGILVSAVLYKKTRPLNNHTSNNSSLNGSLFI